MHRDARGKKTTLLFDLGMSARAAWLSCGEEREGEQPRVSIERAIAPSAEAFFAAWVERLHLRKRLVDPSPLFPEAFEIQPCIGDVVEALRTRFGIEVDPHR
jgi:hypothetical protein